MTIKQNFGQDTFDTPQDARNLIADNIFDRRIFLIFPMDDLFQAKGYTFRELSNRLETQTDFITLQHLEGVSVFSTSEEKDFLSFQTQVAQARDRGSQIVMFARDPMDSVILERDDVMIMFGEQAAKPNISKTRHIARLENFNDACETVAWMRFDLEHSREKHILPPAKRIDWSSYGLDINI